MIVDLTVKFEDPFTQMWWSPLLYLGASQEVTYKGPLMCFKSVQGSISILILTVFILDRLNANTLWKIHKKKIFLCTLYDYVPNMCWLPNILNIFPRRVEKESMFRVGQKNHRPISMMDVNERKHAMVYCHQAIPKI